MIKIRWYRHHYFMAVAVKFHNVAQRSVRSPSRDIILGGRLDIMQCELLSNAPNVRSGNGFRKYCAAVDVRVGTIQFPKTMHSCSRLPFMLGALCGPETADMWGNRKSIVKAQNQAVRGARLAIPTYEVCRHGVPPHNGRSYRDFSSDNVTTVPCCCRCRSKQSGLAEHAEWFMPMKNLSDDVCCSSTSLLIKVKALFVVCSACSSCQAAAMIAQVFRLFFRRFMMNLLLFAFWKLYGTEAWSESLLFLLDSVI